MPDIKKSNGNKQYVSLLIKIVAKKNISSILREWHRKTNDKLY